MPVQPTFSRNDAFFAPARQRRRSTHPLLAILIVAALWFISAIVQSSLSHDPVGDSAVVTALALAPAVVAGYGVRMLGLWGWLSRFERRRPRSLGLPRENAARRVGVGACIGLVLLATVLAIAAITGHVRQLHPAASMHGSAALGES